MKYFNIDGLVPISEAVKQLENCKIIICPDTNIFWQMVCLEKNMDTIHQLSKWLEEMENCRDILDNQEVGWLIPKQIIRELSILFNEQSENKSPFTKRFDVIDKFMNDLKTDEEINNTDLNEINDLIKKSYLKLKTDFEHNWVSMYNKAVLLEEEASIIYKAWELVYSKDFPNKKIQQMKDTTILCHLHEFCCQLKKEQQEQNLQNTHSVYFWTFDGLGDHNNEKFPHEQSDNYIKIINDIMEIKLYQKSFSNFSLI